MPSPCRGRGKRVTHFWGQVSTEQGIGAAQDEVIDHSTELCTPVQTQLRFVCCGIWLSSLENGSLIVLAELRWSAQNPRVAEVDHGIELQRQPGKSQS